MKSNVQNYTVEEIADSNYYSDMKKVLKTLPGEVAGMIGSIFVVDSKGGIMFADSLMPKVLKHINFTIDFNLVLGCKYGILISPGGGYATIKLFNLDNNTLVTSTNIYSTLYASTYESYRLVMAKPMIRQTSIDIYNQNLGSLMDCVIVSPTFNIIQNAGNPLEINCEEKFKLGNVNSLQGVTALIFGQLGSSFKPVDQNDLKNSNSLFVNMTIGTTSIYIPANSTIVITCSGITPGNISLGYFNSNNNTTTNLYTLYISSAAAMTIFNDFPINRLTMPSTGGFLSFTYQEPNPLDYAMFTTISPSSNARTFRVFFQADIEAYCKDGFQKEIFSSSPSFAAGVNYVNIISSTLPTLIYETSKEKEVMHAGVLSDVLSSVTKHIPIIGETLDSIARPIASNIEKTLFGRKNQNVRPVYERKYNASINENEEEEIKQNIAKYAEKISTKKYKIEDLKKFQKVNFKKYKPPVQESTEMVELKEPEIEKSKVCEEKTEEELLPKSEKLVYHSMLNEKEMTPKKEEIPYIIYHNDIDYFIAPKPLECNPLTLEPLVNCPKPPNPVKAICERNNYKSVQVNSTNTALNPNDSFLFKKEMEDYPKHFHAMMDESQNNNRRDVVGNRTFAPKKYNISAPASRSNFLITTGEINTVLTNKQVNTSTLDNNPQRTNRLNKDASINPVSNCSYYFFPIVNDDSGIVVCVSFFNKPEKDVNEQLLCSCYVKPYHKSRPYFLYRQIMGTS